MAISTQIDSCVVHAAVVNGNGTVTWAPFYALSPCYLPTQYLEPSRLRVFLV